MDWIKIDGVRNFPDGSVLLMFENGHIEDATIIDGGSPDWHYLLYDGETLCSRPTHWMPRPADPKAP